MDTSSKVLIGIGIAGALGLGGLAVYTYMNPAAPAPPRNPGKSPENVSVGNGSAVNTYLGDYGGRVDSVPTSDVHRIANMGVFSGTGPASSSSSSLPDFKTVSSVVQTIGGVVTSFT